MKKGVETEMETYTLESTPALFLFLLAMLLAALLCEI